MKRILVMVAVAMMTTMSVNAQNEEQRHEVSVAYGGPSLSQFGSGLGEGIGLAFTNSEYDDGNIFGPISAEYFYHPNNPRLAVGGIITYSTNMPQGSVRYRQRNWLKLDFRDGACPVDTI